MSNEVDNENSDYLIKQLDMTKLERDKHRNGHVEEIHDLEESWVQFKKTINQLITSPR